MSSRAAAAARYARALFDVARRNATEGKPGDPVQVGADLNAFVFLVSSSEELQRAMLNPALPPAPKLNIVQALLQASPLSQPVSRLLAMLAERDRIALLPDIATSYQERLLDFQKVVQAEVTTAVPLPADKAEALRASLAQATGRQVLLQTSVDPSILGGVVAKVGSRVFDGSVARHLERVKAQLIEAGQ
jgi:F-type H+-transporting ATPase subunit delta